MNAIKQATQDVTKSCGNVATAASGLVLVTTSTVKDGTEILANSVAGLPGTLQALWNVPKHTMVGYIQEAEGLSREEALAKVNDMLPDSVAGAITSGAIGTGALVALLMEDEEEEKEQEAAAKE